MFLRSSPSETKNTAAVGHSLSIIINGMTSELEPPAEPRSATRQATKILCKRAHTYTHTLTHTSTILHSDSSIIIHSLPLYQPSAGEGFSSLTHPTDNGREHFIQMELCVRLSVAVCECVCLSTRSVCVHRARTHIHIRVHTYTLGSAVKITLEQPGYAPNIRTRVSSIRCLD